MYYITNPLKKKTFHETFNTFMEALKFQQKVDRKAIITFQVDDTPSNRPPKKIIMWDPLWETKDYGQSGFLDGTPNRKKPKTQ